MAWDQVELESTPTVDSHGSLGPANCSWSSYGNTQQLEPLVGWKMHEYTIQATVLKSQILGQPWGKLSSQECQTLDHLGALQLYMSHLTL